MAIQDVRPYFRTRMTALDYVEHPEGFNTENVPGSNLHEKFHVGISSILGEGNDQDIQTITVGVALSVFLRGFRDSNDGLDDALTRSDEILDEILVANNRLLGATDGIHNVSMEDIELTPLDETNDNAILVTLNFVVLTFKSTRRN